MKKEPDVLSKNTKLEIGPAKYSCSSWFHKNRTYSFMVHNLPSNVGGITPELKTVLLTEIAKDLEAFNSDEYKRIAK